MTKGPNIKIIIDEKLFTITENAPILSGWNTLPIVYVHKHMIII